MTTSPSSARLPAPARRQALVEAGLRVFEGRSYSSSTTAEIAREAGVSEPILYRHFASKRELYFACVDEAWGGLRRAFEAKIEELEPERAVFAIGAVATGLKSKRTLVPNLWIQAITEAGEDPEIRRYLRGHMREVHDLIADVVRRTQECGGVPADRDPDAEAWVFIGGALLVAVADRLGGLLDHDDFAAIAAARHRWLTGEL